MREIFYRGKRKDNGKWMEGFPIRLYDYGGDSWEMVPFNTNLDINHFVIPETIGQYTGMRDKNGRKIFEGDIVRLDEDVKTIFNVNDGTVQYGWGGFYIGGFSALNSLNSLATFDGVMRGEVVGTVFENADLLEG